MIHTVETESLWFAAVFLKEVLGTKFFSYIFILPLSLCIEKNSHDALRNYNGTCCI